MNKSLMVFGILGFAIATLIVIFLLVKQVKNYTQTAKPYVSSTSGTSQGENYITDAKKTKTQSDIQGLSANLEAYRMTQDSYPNTSSYADMVSMLIGRGIIEKEPTKPEGDYHYLYCSFDGTAYIVTAMFGAETIASRGDDSCQPGE